MYPDHPTRGNGVGGGGGAYGPPAGNGYYPNSPLNDIMVIV